MQKIAALTIALTSVLGLGTSDAFAYTNGSALGAASRLGGHSGSLLDATGTGEKQRLHEVPVEKNLVTKRAIKQSGEGRSSSTVIHAPGGEFVKLFFSTVNLPSGAYLHISNPERSQVHLYGKADYESAVPGPDGKTFTPLSIFGDTAIVRIVYPKTIQPSPLDNVYLEKYVTREHNAAVGIIGGVDERRPAVCLKGTHPEIYKRSQSVASIMNFRTGQVGTAWALGTGNRMLTNAHVTVQAAAAEVWFNRETDSCDAPSESEHSVAILGSQTLYSDFHGDVPETDFTLFSLNDFNFVNARIKYLFGGLELATYESDVDDFEPAYIPQHPSFQPRQIAYLKGGTACSASWGAESTWSMPISEFNCDVTGGSSGSPVLSQRTHKVVAMAANASDEYNFGPAAHYMVDYLSHALPPHENVERKAADNVRTNELSLKEGINFRSTIARYNDSVVVDGIETEMSHLLGYSAMVVNARNITSGEVVPVTYRLSVDTACGRTNLATHCANSPHTVVEVAYVAEDNPAVDPSAVFSSWVPLMIKPNMLSAPTEHLLAKVHLGDDVE